jgi:hypothetical protein
VICFTRVPTASNSRLQCLQVGAELPVDSEDAAAENQSENGNTLLFVFERGCDRRYILIVSALLAHSLAQTDLCFCGKKQNTIIDF